MVDILTHNRSPERVLTLMSKLGISVLPPVHSGTQRPHAFQNVVAGFVDGFGSGVTQQLLRSLVPGQDLAFFGHRKCRVGGSLEVQTTHSPAFTCSCDQLTMPIVRMLH